MSESYEKSDIGELVREMEDNYISGSVQSSKYVNTSLAEDVNKIYAYLESKHTTGDQDSLGRDKPFFQVCIADRNTWFRATDIDRKNIKVRPTKDKDVLISYVATALIQDWMRRENFGAFLNDWGINSAGFNESILKFVEQDGRLIPSVVPWNRVICDPINFDANPVIEVLELTEAELYQRKGYDIEMVDKLCEALEARETLEKTDKDSKSNYIKLYEVHGNLPLSYLTGKKKDEDTYAQQMHVISFVESKAKGKYDDFTLYSGKEKNPYYLSALLPEIDGSISLRGSVKNLFEAQWMMNHTVKTIKDQLDLASKLIFQTSDGNFVGQNALFAIETGDILIHALNQPLTQINNGSHDIIQNQNFGTMWKQLGKEINGISDAMSGEIKSGTAWRQIEAQLAESHSLFELMTENKGLDIEQIMRRFVIPHIKKKMDNSEQISTTLDAHGIDKIESIYISKLAAQRLNDKNIDDFLNDREPSGDLATAQQEVQGGLNAGGTQRFFKPSDIPTVTWKEILKDLEWDLEVDVTGESTNTQEMMTTLNTAFSTLVAMQGRPMSPEEKLIFNKILTQAGAVSPMELGGLSTPTLSPVQQTQLATPGGGQPAGGGVEAITQ